MVSQVPDSLGGIAPAAATTLLWGEGWLPIPQLSWHFLIEEERGTTYQSSKPISLFTTYTINCYNILLGECRQVARRHMARSCGRCLAPPLPMAFQGAYYDLAGLGLTNTLRGEPDSRTGPFQLHS